MSRTRKTQLVLSWLRALAPHSVRLSWRAFILMVLALFTCAEPRKAQAQAPRRPNIVFVLLDNVGWGEFGAYGGGALRGAPTPRFDALAGEGLLLQNFNVETSCAPTRTALLTGRFSVRAGTLKSLPSDQRQGLVQWEETIAELLSRQGYATALYGKWHLGDEQGRYPNDQGFDEWYGIPRSSGEALNRTSPGYDPKAVPPEYILEGRRGEHTHVVKEYTMEARRNADGELIEKTIDFMKRNSARHKPFFAYVPLTQVHYPSVPSAAFAGKTGYGDFADSMVQTDYLIGRVLDSIDQLHLRDNTIVVVASDNGPEYRRPWRGTPGFWRGTYHTGLEGGLRAPFLIRWPGKIKPGISNEVVHAVDVFNTLTDAGGAPVPTDRPIDGVDQLPYFTGARPHSARDGFPIFNEGELIGAKWRDWKYFLLWQPDTDDKEMKLVRPYLFNVVTDPKEESPRIGLLEDSWIRDKMDEVISGIQSSLAKYPPIPLSQPDPYIPPWGQSLQQNPIKQ